MSLINFSKANCKSCYKCLRSCPVKAIRIQNDQAEIVEERCTACGQCLAVCPQNARQIQSDLQEIKSAISLGKRTIAIVAPSFAGAFDMEDEYQFVNALKKLGFKSVQEVAIGAQVILDVYEDTMEKSDMKSLITTSCPSINYLIETYYPSLIQYMIPAVSPMIAHGKLLKHKYDSDCFIVFVGPCTAKKFESVDASNTGIIDAVITFDELGKWFEEEGVNLKSLTPVPFDENTVSTCREFPISGKWMKESAKYEAIACDGMTRCISLFKAMESGSLQGVVVEALACSGGCIGGCAMPKDDVDFYVRQKKVKKYTMKEKGPSVPVSIKVSEKIDFSRTFTDCSLKFLAASERKILDILHKMGKFECGDELNCGVCGYNTCREKAQAVLDGMAEINMCIHHIRNQAESITNVVFEMSPNAIFTLDEELFIKNYNPACKKLFKLENTDIRDKPISMILNDVNFIKVKETKENVLGNKVAYPEYDLVLLENIIYLEKNGVILAIMNDITMDEKSKVELARVKEKTLNAAQQVIDKQMRVAQEIASLLGETTAETKVILTKLKAIALEE